MVKLIRRHDNRLPICGADVGQVPILNLTSRTSEYGQFLFIMETCAQNSCSAMTPSTIERFVGVTKASQNWFLRNGRCVKTMMAYVLFRLIVYTFIFE